MTLRDIWSKNKFTNFKHFLTPPNLHILQIVAMEDPQIVFGAKWHSLASHTVRYKQSWKKKKKEKESNALDFNVLQTRKV